MRNDLRLLSVLVLTMLLSLLSTNMEAAPAKEESDKKGSAAKPWEFDESLYTNNQKTGDRVWQYQKPKNAYRDPNAWFDSQHTAYPFNGDWTLQPYDVFPYPYSPGPNGEHPSYAPDPYWPESQPYWPESQED